MGRREFEDSFAGVGRKIDDALNAGGEARRRLHNRLATGGLFERFQRAGDGPTAKERLAERVGDWRERLESGRVSAKLVLGAFGAGAGVVVAVVLVLVFGFGLFRGTGLTAADLERDAQLRQAADRARAEQQGTLNPAAMLQRQQQADAAEAEAASAREASRGRRGESGRAGMPGGG